MIRNMDVPERLYLSKEDELIYIDNCKIPQHHIEGIRFLYRQFKRKREGVIINDPHNYGRNLQTVLFLKAVRRLLDKPILILCKEGAQDDWVDRFDTWTDLCDDVVVETVKPFIKKSVIVNPTSNLPQFCRREWSVLVVDGDRHSAEILAAPFRADFKIWNTPVNMRENLDKFADIYKWLYPMEIFDKYEFIPNKDNVIDVIDKAILLDSFMEDIVIRRDDLDASFQKYKKDADVPKPTPKKEVVVPAIEPPPIIMGPPKPVSRKNKDATGTKIKRSKRKIDVIEESKPDDNTDRRTVETSHTIINEIENIKRQESKTSSTIDELSKRTESSIDSEMDNKEVGMDDKQEADCVMEVDNACSDSDMKLYLEPDSCTDERLYEMDTCEMSQPINVINESTALDHGDKKDGIINTSADDAMETDTNICKYETHGNHKTALKSTDATYLLISETKNDGIHTTKAAENNFTDEKKLLTDLEKVNMSPNNEMKIDQNILESNKGTTVSGIKNVDKEKCSDAIYDHNKSNLNEQNKDDDLNKIDSESNNKLKRNIDDKMREIEERALKKFKGTIFDSLF